MGFFIPFNSMEPIQRHFENLRCPALKPRKGAAEGDEFAQEGVVAAVGVAAFLSQEVVKDEFGLVKRGFALDEAGVAEFSKSNGDQT